MDDAAPRNDRDAAPNPLTSYGGWAGAVVPFAVFLAGVTWLGISGAPDERGFWAILLAALAVGLVLARDRSRYADTLIAGMSQPIVMLMIMAWLLSGVLATLMGASGFVQALVWTAGRAGVEGGAYAAAAFLVCALVSTSTGTSFGTILICGPLLYPAGGTAGADAAVLIGAILGGATFGDSISPISDTTIASASTQGADIGGVVRSRLKYVLPAGVVASIFALLRGGGTGVTDAVTMAAGDPRGLPMIAVPLLVIVLLLGRRHLIEGLFAGILAALALGLALDLIQPGQVLYVDHAKFGARGLIVEGLERGIGVSVFTLLLVALVATVQAAGLIDRLIPRSEAGTESATTAEGWIFATVSAAVLLTTHSVVAILTVGNFARRVGARAGLTAYRRANILDVTVCTYPFLLPYFIPTILASNATAAGTAYGMPRVGPLAAGVHNAYSWALLAIVLFAIVTGFGRTEGNRAEDGMRS